MANEEQLAILKQGVDVWNKWREAHPWRDIDLSEVDFHGIDLRNADLSGVVLFAADLQGFDLVGVNLNGANLRGADLSKAKLSGVILRRANLSRANLEGANLREADLSGAYVASANLQGVRLVLARIPLADFEGANLREANLSYTDLGGTVLRGADLTSADLSGADLTHADLSGCKLIGTKLRYAKLNSADLTGADLTNADLSWTTLVQTKMDMAKVSGSAVYGSNVWDLEGEPKEQKDLVITPDNKPVITVDNIKVAQFIYLILNNEEIRDVINTLTSKSVLILGRFAIPERKAILDALRNKLREYDLLPIVFDFDRPTYKDFTETIKTLAGLCYFVIADVTNPKSSPLELQATVPDYQIPFVPIIQEGEQPFAMMVDLQKKYNWVLDTLSYNSIGALIQAVKPAIIDPAIEKHHELRLIKAQERKIRRAEDFIGNRGLDSQ